MNPALTQHDTYLSQPTWRNRLVSFVLAIATTVLIALMMLAMGTFTPHDKARESSLVAIQIPQESGSKAPHPPTATKHSAAPPQPHPPVPQPQPHVVKPVVAVTPLLSLSKEEYAASDISKLPSHAAEGSGSNGSSGNSASYGPGDGPGGQHLFNAEWYREPTHAELATYLSQTSAPGEWATIACKTIEHYHVENCQELDESPPGSGLARALRRAAWQFLVRPPRVDGHVLIGSWVRIKFTFTKSYGSEPVEEPVPGADNGP